MEQSEVKVELKLGDWLKSINENKNYLLTEENKEQYPSFVINRTLSYFPDTVLLVNEINRYGLTFEMEYDFLINIIEKRKRYSGKWEQKDREIGKYLNKICTLLRCSTNDAKGILKKCSEDQLKELDSVFEII